MKTPLTLMKLMKPIQIISTYKLLTAVSKIHVCSCLCISKLTLYVDSRPVSSAGQSGTSQGQGHTFHWPQWSRKLCDSHYLDKEFHTVISWSWVLGLIKPSQESSVGLEISTTLFGKTHTTLYGGGNDLSFMCEWHRLHRYSQTYKVNSTREEKKLHVF